MNAKTNYIVFEDSLFICELLSQATRKVHFSTTFLGAISRGRVSNSRA